MNPSKKDFRLKFSPDFDERETENKLLALDKAAYTLLKENRWYNPAYGEKK